METKVYKIRNKETGLFSKGGTSTWDIWTKGGKTWTNIGHVKSHLSQLMNRVSRRNADDYPYYNAEIVEVVVNYDECFKYDVSVLVDDIAEKKAKESERATELHRKWAEEREKKKLAELKRKYEN